MLRRLAARYDRFATRLRRDSVDSLEAAARRHSQRWRLVRALLFACIAVGYSGALLAGGVIAGVVVEREKIPDRVLRRLDLEQRLAALRTNLGVGGPEIQRAEWNEVVLNQHTIEWASITVRPPGIRGGALTEVAGHIVFSSPLGRINYLSAQNRLADLNLQAPTNLEGLRKSPLLDNPMFSAAEFRVHDLAARQIGTNSWELYASLSRYNGDDCFQFQIVRALLTARSDALVADSPDWETVYTARPGCIPQKDRGWLFQGVGAGGRMVFTGEHTMLVTVGDHQLDGFNDHRSVSMDMDWDLGKILELDVDTGAARVFASGLRNPQGLVVMRDGRIFSTEHGPQGGDEINFIRRGQNYGWPLVSYGMNYGFPRREWSSDPTPGGHGGYTRPAMAFVPALGISNLVQPNAEEFPLWADDGLLMLSLNAGKLFHVAVHGDDVAYVEPIELGARLLGRERLRDIASLRDGRVVILTDNGKMIFVRNAERHEAAPDEIVVSGYGDLSAPLAEELFDDEGTPAQRGRRYFEAACASCHSLDGNAGIGPPLNGVVGRRVGGAGNFQYSAALADYDGVWNERMLRAYILDPDQHFPGTTMAEPPISWTMAPRIVAYLRTTR